MAKRDAARAEAAFLRGDAGVDGAATDADQRDAVEIERDKARDEVLRGRTWLGRELLTWLLWRSESGDPLVQVEGAGLVVLFTGRITLRGIAGEVTELTARGAEAPYAAQVRRALDAGLLVHQARLRFTHGEDDAQKVYEATLDAEHLDVRAAKLPELMAEEGDDRMLERLSLAAQLSRFVDALVAAFLEERASRAWGKRTVPALKRWMQAG
ncbi:hypothetical protein [Anaeromyxobacter diazotrophicus]|uniref:Uncharacterized protein n=1 Tax=Anaeromyxobacter diazotrophicus TaxID=2590199 RepID=A0A7I9VSG5_9BACT|nr:hypothetical protein [Anaeromyxobacter diazotrophicus]GEJ58867.1 hypothetical protein AMYX_36080 [Anaeromyxobacter diazotrophicus]